MIHVCAFSKGNVVFVFLKSVYTFKELRTPSVCMQYNKPYVLAGRFVATTLK